MPTAKFDFRKDLIDLASFFCWRHLYFIIHERKKFLPPSFWTSTKLCRPSETSGFLETTNQTWKEQTRNVLFFWQRIFATLNKFQILAKNETLKKKVLFPFWTVRKTCQKSLLLRFFLFQNLNFWEGEIASANFVSVRKTREIWNFQIWKLILLYL